MVNCARSRPACVSLGTRVSISAAAHGCLGLSGALVTVSRIRRILLAHVPRQRRRHHHWEALLLFLARLPVAVPLVAVVVPLVVVVVVVVVAHLAVGGAVPHFPLSKKIEDESIIY